MNPLTNAANLKKLNEREIELGIAGTKTSWHNIYKDSAWIFVGGLPYDLSEGDVICVFSQYGEIVNLNMIRDKKTGKTKGYAFICYEDQRSTILAVDNLNGIKLLQRTIRVDHVKDYKPPDADDKNIDDETRRVRAEGVAPKPIVEPESSDGDDFLLPYDGDNKHKKKKKDKNKKKDKKLKKELKKEPSSPTSPQKRNSKEESSKENSNKKQSDKSPQHSTGRDWIKRERHDSAYDRVAFNTSYSAQKHHESNSRDRESRSRSKESRNSGRSSSRKVNEREEEHPSSWSRRSPSPGRRRRSPQSPPRGSRRSPDKSSRRSRSRSRDRRKWQETKK